VSGSGTTLLDARQVEALVAMRREIHEHAEIAFEEVRTAAMIADRLRALGLEPREGVAGTGVTALLHGSRPGPTLILRAETDALPIVEETDVPFRSRNRGAMHACGHDAHVAIVLTVAELLAAGDFPGTVKLVFQPAEEICGGARAMVDAGVMEADREVDMVLALHLHGHLDAGTVGVCDGIATASASDFAVHVRGRGGHGAFPEATRDPIVAAGQLITALQTVVSREIASTERAVLSVCTMSAGTAMNISPELAELSGTIRSVDDDVHAHLVQRAGELVNGIAGAFRCEGTFDARLLAPSVRNDPALGAIVRQAAAEVVGPEHVLIPRPVMAGDDLAYFFKHARGCYFFVGAAYTDGRPQTTHHISTWDIDERCLPIGVEVLYRAAHRALASAADEAPQSRSQ
jgi:amidohydrolase